jgi:hypothetical protein
MAEFGSKGLAVIGPTQHYGYVAGGVDAGRDIETDYIDSVRRTFYSALAEASVPVAGENFENYGVSSTPTLVLVDRKGIVRMYHPGMMPYAELAARVRAIL